MNLCSSARKFLTELVATLPSGDDHWPQLSQLLDVAIGYIEDVYYATDSTNLLLQDLYDNWEGYLESAAKVGQCVTGQPGAEWVRTACDTWSTEPRGGSAAERDLVVQVHNLYNTKLAIEGGVEITGATNQSQPVYVKWDVAQPVSDNDLAKAVQDLTSGLATDFEGLDSAITTAGTEVTTALGTISTAAGAIATAIGSAAGTIGGAISGLATAIIGAGLLGAGGNLLSGLLGGAYHMSGIHNLLHGFNPTTGGSLLSGAVHGIGHLFHHSSGSDTDAELNYNLQHRLDPLVNAYDGVNSFRQSVTSWKATETVNVKTSGTETIKVSGTVGLDTTNPVDVSGTVKIDENSQVTVGGTVHVENTELTPLHVVGNLSIPTGATVGISSPLTTLNQVAVGDSEALVQLKEMVELMRQLVFALGGNPDGPLYQPTTLRVRMDPAYFASDEIRMSTDGSTLYTVYAGESHASRDPGSNTLGRPVCLKAPVAHEFIGQGQVVIKANSNASLATY